MKVLVLIYSLFTGVNSFGQVSDVCPVIPTPTNYTPIEGHFWVTDTLRIFVDEGYDESIDYLEAQLALRSIVLKRTDDIYKSGLRLWKSDVELGNGYKFMAKNHCEMVYSSREGSFSGMNTFLQLIDYNSEHNLIQKCFIEDEPRFDWRGLHLDVSRHFFSVEEIKKFIDIMALYKFNKFHWHLTDDQCWRIEIQK
jgi:hexosaminidase